MREIIGLFVVCLLVAGCLNKTGNRQKAVDGDGVSLPENLPTDEELGGYSINDRQADIKELYIADY